MKEILECGKTFSIIMSGGGFKFLHDLTKNGGASKILNHVEIPYSKEELDKFFVFKKACSDFTASIMAGNAAVRADVGLGICCSLGYEGQREGRLNQAYVAISDSEKTMWARFIYQGSMTREQQEEALSDGIRRFILSYLRGEDKWSYIEKGNISKPMVVYSGSFNPFHQGHFDIYNKLTEMGYDVIFEISLYNVDKDTIDLEDVYQRIQTIKQFVPNPIVFPTEAATFDEKSQMFDCPFVVGADTFNRIPNPQQEFIIFPREGVDLVIPEGFTNYKIIDMVPSKVSSRELRNEI